MWAEQLCRYSDWLRAGRSEDRILVEVRFSAPVQTGPGVHPASCTMGTGSFPGVKSGRSVTLTPHPLLVSLVMKEQSYTSTLPYEPYGLYRASVPVQGCTLPFTFSPQYRPRRPRGGVMIQLHSFNLGARWGGWLTPRPGRFTPKKSRYPLYRWLGGPQGRSGRLRKISPPPGFDPRTVQPVASRYTD